MFSVACLRLLIRSVVNLSRFSQPRHVQVILMLSLPCPVVLTRFWDSFHSCRHLGTLSWFASSSTVCFFLDVCSFLRSWDASLCSFLVIFFLFLPSPVGKLLCCRRFPIFFCKTQQKKGLYLVTVFGKGIKFHLSFSVFHFLAFGTCRDKTHVQFFWQEQPWSTKREWH